ncbi:MAG: sigma 54-dependent Fis family transcriptional regulator [Myxococcales bacterium]|nr:sigma 54-dependent Fis family transcriptional regulator [Myxococcales bacterium]MCB9608292.1 sigma 54-dependent Fis family transcriptional regulator [Polyangiaceae bacterium]
MSTSDWTHARLTNAIPSKLVVLSGASAGLELPIEGKLTIGSAPGCDVTLRDPHVSRSHAELELRQGRILVRDIGSRNGTYVGNHRVVEAEVSLGAVIRIAETALAVEPRWSVREVNPSNARTFGELTGRSVKMREIFAILQRVSPTDATVLVEGESGTGKELAARAIHAASRRSDRPCVVFDCASIPRDLAESELFGHRRGAFSGAVSDRDGAFKNAHGGTIFLDEIGELPLELQPKLLRVLESGEVRSVGDDAPTRVDVRIIAATNRDLQAEVRRGRFREDLLYRLDVIKVRLPALRERFEDISDIAAQLLEGALAPGSAIAGPNLQRLMAYHWPGNVRELRNVLERAVVLAERPVEFERLVLNVGQGTPQPSTIGGALPGVAIPMPFKQAKDQVLEGFERAYLDALMSRHRGNLTQAAAAAGLSRKHLADLCRKYHDSRGDTLR